MPDPVSSLFVSYLVTNIAQKALEGYVQKFVTNAIADGVKSVDKKLAGDIVRKALKEFAIAFGTELHTAGLNRARAKPFRKPVMAFLLEEEVQATLTEALKASCHSIDARVLARCWKTGYYRQLVPQWFPRGERLFPTTFKENYPSLVYGKPFPFLPPEFDWGRVSQAYFEAVCNLIKTDEQLRAVYTVELTEQIAAAQGIQADFDLRKYAESLQETYGTLRIQSLAKSANLHDRPVKLFRVFVPQMARECGGYLPHYDWQKRDLEILRQRGGIAEDFDPDRAEVLKQTYLDRSANPVQAFLEPGNAQYAKYLVVLGDPGSGKSSLLQWLALRWAHLKDTDPNKLVLEPLPIVIELRRYFAEWRETQCSFLEFLHRGSSAVCHLNQHTLKEWLDRGQAIVMFDGLDEIFHETHRETITTAIHRFTNDHRDVQVVVTSRPIGYDDRILRNAEFQHVMLQDFEDEQIEEFSQKWHEQVYLDDEPEREEKQERLARSIAVSTPIRLLARNPLLLTLMAILNRYQELPRDRSELYGDAARLLLYQWDEEVKKFPQEGRILAQLDYRDKAQILQRLAFSMQTNGDKLSGNAIDVKTLETILSEELATRQFNADSLALARKLIEQLRGRNFILCFLGNDYYAFVHRTFLEYFCAQELAARFERRDAPNAKNAIGVKELIGLYRTHWQEKDWHEVLRLLVSSIPVGFAGQAIKALLEQETADDKEENDPATALFLAADCLGELRDRSDVKDQATEIDCRLKEFAKTPGLNSDLSQRVINTVTELSFIGSRGTLTWLQGCLDYDRSSYIPESAVQAIAQNWKQNNSDFDCLTWLRHRATEDKNEYVRATAVKEIAEHFKNEETRSLLLEWVRQDEHSDVRGAAVSALGEHFKNEETRSLLLERVRQDEDFEVRRAAVSALGEHFKNEETRSLLLERVRQDEDFEVRRAAVSALGEHFKNEETRSLLLERVRQDEHSEVRRAAVYALGEHFKNEETRSLLLERVRQDEHFFVRMAAVSALAEHFKNEETRSLLLEWVRQDEHSDVRMAAVSALGEHFKNEETRSLLLEWVRQDEHSDVRGAAVSALGEHFKNEETRSLLVEWVRRDEDFEVRRAAVYALGEHFKDEETRSLLVERVRQDEHSDVRRAAVSALAAHFEDEETRSLLLEWVRQDEHSDVRRAAVSALAAHFEDEETRSLLLERVRRDEHSDVRSTALKAIAYTQAPTPQTFDLLCDVARHDPFVREYDTHTNPRQTALELLLDRFPNKLLETVILLRDRAQNDPDEKLQNWAQEKLSELDTKSA
ncbi:HEAT repeat domain-containing protein [Baaleninema simplex]|uniref:HEAT repeat domain-containing protein n=1 Tax=Baaleninema simplex TaxID=2862350 RepID=UPI000368D218|nr:HEAT repeat domain-containing protein [Baaleninema simplex]